MQYRTLTFGRANANARTVPVTVSTEEPVERGSFIEVLSHAPGDIDLSRAPLPLVECHDTSKLNIGVIENLKASDGKLTGVARFGTSLRGEEVFQDVLNGVVRSVSVGYVLTDDGTVVSGDGHTIRFKWMPYEVSCVPAPADTNAGFFRNFQEIEMDQIEQSRNVLSRSQRIAAKNTAEGERLRVQEIQALGQQFTDFRGIRDLADAAIRDGVPTAVFTERLLEAVGSDSHRNWLPEIGSSFGGMGLNQREAKRYSLSRAIEAQATGDWSKAGYEREIHQDLARNVSHRSISGLLVPMADLARAQRRDLLASNPTAGGSLVGTDHRDDLFVDALREKSAVLSLGAQFVDGLVGNIDIPTLAGDVTPNWIASEGSLITESQPTFGQILMSPKSCAAFTDVSRRLLQQTSQQAERLLTNSMVASIAYAIDTAAISGSGINGQPKGLLLANGVSSADGTALDWNDILEFESDVSSSFVDLAGASCGWVTTPLIRKLLKGRVKVAGYPEYLWQSPDNRMNGYAAMATTACPTGHLIFGDWSEVIVGNWGPVEILCDPYSKIQSALVAVRAIADVDIAIKHSGAFCIAPTVT